MDRLAVCEVLVLRVRPLRQVPDPHFHRRHFREEAQDKGQAEGPASKSGHKMADEKRLIAKELPGRTVASGLRRWLR